MFCRLRVVSYLGCPSAASKHSIKHMAAAEQKWSHPAPCTLIKPLNATRLTRLCLCLLIKQAELFFQLPPPLLLTLSTGIIFWTLGCWQHFFFSHTHTQTWNRSESIGINVNELWLPHVHSAFLSPLKWNGSPHPRLVLPFTIAFLSLQMLVGTTTGNI